jgi:hypothetical protein
MTMNDVRMIHGLDYTRMIHDHETLWRCEKCRALLEIRKYSCMNSSPEVHEIVASIMIRFYPCCGMKISSLNYYSDERIKSENVKVVEDTKKTHEIEQILDKLKELIEEE